MINNNEQQRKKWIMYKKAITLIPFVSHWDIVPTFTSTQKDATEKKSNEYGEWIASSTAYPVLLCKNDWSLYDWEKPLISTLILPPNCSITFSTVSVSSSVALTVSGLNVETNQWETIITTDSTNANVPGNAGKYFSALKFVYPNNKSCKGPFQVKNGMLKVG